MSLKETMRDGMLASYRFRECALTNCAICERSITRAAFEMIWYYTNPNSDVPDHAQVQVIGGGKTWRVVTPICDKCAPPCKKCDLPRRTKKVAVYANKLSAMRSSPVKGQGYCQHSHVFGMIL
jgi:hypothetical protein